MPSTPAPAPGFTLIELLVTLAVAAILVSVAIPNFQTFVASNRMASQANDLIAALNLARSEAVKRGSSVDVCASSDGSTCTGGWASGWIIKDASGVIRVQQALTGNSTLTSAVTTIPFRSNGRTSLAASATLTLCPPSPAVVSGRTVSVELTGRPSVAAVTCP